MVFVRIILALAILTAGNLVHARGEGDQYVFNSLQALLLLRTIKCDIRIETFVDGRQFTAQGHYAEQALPNAAPGTFLRSVHRLEINFPMVASNAEPNRMTLVCHASADGRIHQVQRYTSIEGNQSFITIDLIRLEQRLRDTQRNLFFSHVGEVRNLGGLAGKMRQISRFYEFSPPTREDLHDREAVPTWKLTGTLRSIYRRELLGKFGGLDERRGNYPVSFPSDIEIWIGRHDNFPYKIRYLRRPSEHSEQRRPLYQESFHNVELDGPPLPSVTFAPLTFHGVRVSDETDNFLRALGL